MTKSRNCQECTALFVCDTCIKKLPLYQQEVIKKLQKELAVLDFKVEFGGLEKEVELETLKKPIRKRIYVPPRRSFY